MPKIFFLLLALGITLSNLQAKNLKIAVVSGYKKPILKIIKLYEQKNEVEIDAIFGNTKQLLTQAKRIDLDIIIGGKNYLSKRGKLNFIKYQEIGIGKLVLAFSKKIELNDFNQLTQKYIKKVAMPQPKRTIYGMSGQEFLINANLYEKVKERLYIVTTPLQVATYLVANEVDVGIMNLTTTLANAERIGGYIEIPQKYYSKILIVAGVLPSCEKNVECKKIISFLDSKESKEIFREYGL
ncbi:MAG: molybdate ABC transporter substrate-binding protein [Campylobacterota bacterium]|nr:molybdate ABC transporter substrate-binding protein [Campylobacterota bacterium]